MRTAIAAWLMVLAADNAIPSGDLVLHPMSEWAVVNQPGWPTRHVPDDRVDLALTSYALPTRGTESEGALACRFTLSMEDGKTDAAVGAADEKAACAMGDLTGSVVETLRTWRFEIQHERKKKRGRYWLDVTVGFAVGESTADVEVAQGSLASRMPATPYEGLNIVRRPSPKRRVSPRFPSSGIPGKGGVCAIHFWIDAEGVPTDIGVKECVDSVHDAVLKAAWKWRFDPALVNGEPRDSEFDLKIYVQGNGAQ